MCPTEVTAGWQGGGGGSGWQLAVSEGMWWSQVVDPDTVLLALNFLRQVNNPYFRAGFNSLGAYGTINHLHFQVRS